MSQIPPGGLLEYQTPQGPQQSRVRFVTFILLLVLGILLILGGLCATGGLAFVALALRSAKGGVHGSPEVLFIGLGVGVLVLWVGGGITYVVCSLKIRHGGHAPVTVALVLASLHAFLAMAMTVLGLISATSSSRGEQVASAIAGTIFYALIAAYLGVVIFFLVKILREPRWPMA